MGSDASFAQPRLALRRAHFRTTLSTMTLLSSMKNACAQLETTRAFTVTSWAVVLASCISVVLFDPTDRRCNTTACKQLTVFTVIV